MLQRSISYIPNYHSLFICTLLRKLLKQTHTFRDATVKIKYGSSYPINRILKLTNKLTDKINFFFVALLILSRNLYTELYVLFRLCFNCGFFVIPFIFNSIILRNHCCSFSCPFCFYLSFSLYIIVCIYPFY